MPYKGKPAQQAYSGAIPLITNADLRTFYQAHFSDEAVQNFSREFLGNSGSHAAEHPASGDGYDQEDEDDGLGFYPDGAKRTLTDEQIAIFRHSEIQTLRREQNKRDRDCPSARVTSPPDGAEGEKDGPSVEKDVENEELQMRVPARERQRKRGTKHKRQEPKPDLRKRTWDIVEAGIDTLDYD